ncbi:MAG: AbrB/MazE/SpoVT family DNA-binding domain-containing protein [Terracidiphilus sp.]|jgi:AbrB family looped-hinge helix DNA binding protein
MPTAMVTFNGRITLPPQVRRNLGLKTGDNVEFVEVEKGRFAISCRNRFIADTDLRSPKLDPAPIAEEEKQPVL